MYVSKHAKIDLDFINITMTFQNIGACTVLWFITQRFICMYKKKVYFLTIYIYIFPIYINKTF